LKTIAITAPPKDAFFTHQVVIRFQIKKARYASKNSLAEPKRFPAREMRLSRSNRGTKAKKMGKESPPVSGQEKANNNPLHKTRKNGCLKITAQN